MDKHTHNFKPVDFFGTKTYQCSCGAYSRGEKMRKQTRKWTMLTGKKIRICDMSDEHLKNTIQMLILSACSMMREEDDILSDYLPEIYYNLADDLKRRINDV